MPTYKMPTVPNVNTPKTPAVPKKFVKHHSTELRRSTFVSQDKKVVLLIDGSNMFIRNCTAPNLMELTNASGQPTGAIYGTLRSLVREMRIWCPTDVFFVLDKSKSQRRINLYPEYKANRGRGLVSGSQEYTAEDREAHEARMRQLTVLEHVLPHMGVRPIHVTGFEADDLIAGLVYFYKNDPDVVTVVCSSDSDFVQLHDGHSCFVYSPLKRRMPSEKEYGAVGASYALAKSVFGDLETDNIPGIKGIGPKTMHKLYNETLVPTTLDELKQAASMLKDKKGRKFANSILEQWDLVERNYQLICLDPEITKIPATVTLMMRSWRETALDVSLPHIMKTLRTENIDVRLMQDIIEATQCLRKSQ